ncbi:hypothetical protein [Methylobacterium oxalidis]|uniref:hypothetical protein n=1 Tax=Methylobacterium oxalidis TaxID=944322 RepID=UPI0011BEBC40|nr:hypothetical protein [Methylobacterium oxalidis]GJE33772.1 hypothetical protein LDDCCGHA_3975 [Methylobacterium oxalidis]
MPKKPAWIMSETDAFDLLNAIDERLATARLGQQQHDLLVRLQSLLEDDLGGERAMRTLLG